MQIKVKTLIILPAAIILFAAGCDSKQYPSVSDICGIWLKIKMEIGSTSRTEPGLTEPGLIDDFLFTLDEFFASPVGFLYQTRRAGEMSSVKAIIPAVNKLKAAIQSGNREGIFLVFPEIDKAVDALRRLDTDFSETSQMHYFLLFFFFSLLVIGSILILGALQGRLEKAEIRAQQSLAFSRETVMAQEQERSRIARELHDTVSQDLWRLSFQTDSIDKTADSAERSRLCAEVVNGQKELMRRVRDICDTLIPPDFHRRGLGDALRRLCYNFRQRTGVECQVTCKMGLEAMDSDMQLQCFRIVQECLANIEKHAGATEVSVLVDQRRSLEQPCELLICVADNGRGFSPVNRDSSHILRAKGHFGL